MNHYYFGLLGPLEQKRHKQAMMTLQGMADHKFTSASLFTNVFLGEIILGPYLIRYMCTLLGVRARAGLPIESA